MSQQEINPQYPTGFVPKQDKPLELVPMEESKNPVWNADHAVVFGGRPSPQVQTPENQEKIRQQSPEFFNMDETKKSSPKKHNHYYKDVSKLEFVDVYRVLGLFNVTDPCLQHAVKKLLVAGGRGAGKDIKQDIEEAISSLERFLEMKRENGK